jgi:4-oxalocrotonate tautomerase family enzyme
MPLIQIKVVKGGLPEEKKAEMIKRVSEVVAEIEARPYPKEKILPIVWCIVEEVPAEQWGVGGQAVDLEKLKELLFS